MSSEGWTKLPNALLKKGVLNGEEVLTLQAIVNFQNMPEGQAYPSHKTMSNVRGISESSIRNHLRKLEKHKFIRKQFRPGSTTIYVSIGGCQDVDRVGCQNLDTLPTEGVKMLTGGVSTFGQGGCQDVDTKQEPLNKNKRIITTNPLSLKESPGDTQPVDADGGGVGGQYLLDFEEWLRSEGVGATGSCIDILKRLPKDKAIERIDEIQQAKNGGLIASAGGIYHALKNNFAFEFKKEPITVENGSGVQYVPCGRMHTDKQFDTVGNQAQRILKLLGEIQPPPISDDEAKRKKAKGRRPIQAPIPPMGGGWPDLQRSEREGGCDSISERANEG